MGMQPEDGYDTPGSATTIVPGARRGGAPKSRPYSTLPMGSGRMPFAYALSKVGSREAEGLAQ